MASSRALARPAVVLRLSGAVVLGRVDRLPEAVTAPVVGDTPRLAEPLPDSQPARSRVAAARHATAARTCGLSIGRASVMLESTRRQPDVD